MISWNAPARPSEYTEAALVAAILDGDFPPGTTLPGERALAGQLGVTRPTLREAIQRLARDGWLTVAHGKPTVVNDFWGKGGLNVLGKLVEHPEPPAGRFHPATCLKCACISRRPIRDWRSRGLRRASPIFLPRPPASKTPPEAFARFDWHLHQQLTILSGNPIYTLILNGFSGFYENVARIYFSRDGARKLSAAFYEDLRRSASDADPVAAEALCRYIMLTSLDIWRVGEKVNGAIPRMKPCVVGMVGETTRFSIHYRRAR